MNGIISDDFQLLLTKNNYILDELIVNLSELKKSVLSLSSNISKSNFKFYINKLNSEIAQLETIEKKVNGYHTTLANVYKSYEEQSIEIVRSVKDNLIS